MGYAEILRRVNLDTLNVRRDSICQTYFDKIKVGTHRLNYLLLDKRHTEYNIRQQNVYPLPVTRTNRFRKFFIQWALYNCQSNSVELLIKLVLLLLNVAFCNIVHTRLE